MADGVKFTGEVGRSITTFSAYPEEILIDPELNGRHEHTTVESLAADIAINGQMQPVTCRKDDQGRPVLVFGHRRFRAICLLNEQNPTALRKVIFIYRAKMSPEEALVMAVAENRFRKDVSPIDDAANIEVFRRRFGKTDEDLIKIYFPEATTEDDLKAAAKFIKDRSALIELAPEAAQAVRDGRVKLTAAVALSKLTRDQQKKKVAKEGKIKGSDVAPATSKPKKVKPVKIDEELKRRILAVVDSAPWETLDEQEATIPVNVVFLAALKNYLLAE